MFVRREKGCLESNAMLENLMIYFCLKFIFIIVQTTRTHIFLKTNLFSICTYFLTLITVIPFEIQTRMLKLQKKAARYKLDVDYFYPSSGLFKTLKWLPFFNRV